ARGRAVAPSGIAKESINSICRVVGAAGIVKERLNAHRRVAGTGVIEVERLTAQGRIPEASRKAEQGVGSLSRVPACIAAVRRRSNRLHSGQNRKATEHERDKKRTLP